MNGTTILGLIGMWLMYRLVTSNGRIAAIIGTLTPEPDRCGSCGGPINPYTAECRCSQ